ncbi:ArnT family glycosyltransferase [Flavihumibacter stibioxidans]|uniref:Glycosyltransferase RgtA/B/C/D-like domain-containing protein n=1 Tax=Flavihumibacter stibioxidans TaxID=1834163 RepID=A0ABR7MCU6_9BACT|nr:glycosyltransferase family 39 protein [Flavihumibacter stibioxidans]MBC6492858.1 hypothetical protein [Flavihumibacter stibioxidans]
MFASINRSVRNNTRTWFYAGWLIINLIQSAGTELLDDEAYYWVYSRFPDWGYFDHPPMIAILIKAGYALFSNELGVRLFMALMNTATLWLIQKMLLVNNDRLFYSIALSMGVLQIGGILAVPDIPLTFFTALFFWQYKQFLHKTDWIQALLLGTVMALMLYSKYHGVLIILFTLLSNRKLALQWQAWLAAIFGMLLFSPHLWWQYTHDFPSVMYHLKERNAPAYRFSFTLEYIGGQILLAGPLIGWLLLYAAGKFRANDFFARALKLSMIGFYGFFLLSTLKGRVEANWTVPALVPLIILAHAWLTNSVKGSRWVYRLMAPALVAVFVVRLYMLSDIPSLSARFKDEMHNNKTWAAAIKEKSVGLPVVFMSSYQRPSKYWFYSGDTSFAINNTGYRRNNYNFWPMEKDWQGRTVFLVDYLLDSLPGSQAIETAKGKTAGVVIEKLESHSFVQLKLVGEKLRVQDGQLVPFELEMPVEFGKQILSEQRGDEIKTELVLDIFEGKQYLQTLSLQVEPSGKNWKAFSTARVLAGSGKFIGKLGLSHMVPGLYSQNSPSLPLEVISPTK